MISIKKGITLPISGGITDTTIHTLDSQSDVAVLGDDFIGLKPTMKVVEGDKVKVGQPLFEDKKNPGVFIGSPISGRVESINRGERRKLLSVIISPGGDEALTFDSVNDISSCERSYIVERMREAGAWAMLRTRPYNKIPKLDSMPAAVFVNVMDSNPLSFDPVVTLVDREDDYHAGLEVVSKLTDGMVHVCHDSSSTLPISQLEQVKYHAFGGIHPAGLVGTHIHFIEPVGTEKTVWHLGIQDLLALGKLFRTGIIDQHKVIAVAGPGVKESKLIRVVRGTSMKAILADNLQAHEQRLISGSVFAGRKAVDETAFLGFYDQQISVIPEAGDDASVFLEFVRPGAKSYSRTRAYLGRFIHKTGLPFTTAVQGSPRAILPYGIYEEVMALDILPALLLKALVVKDTDTAINLGALELDEEDIALLTYVDPGKHDFGAILRENLTLIEQEG